MVGAGVQYVWESSEIIGLSASAAALNCVFALWQIRKGDDPSQAVVLYRYIRMSSHLTNPLILASTTLLAVGFGLWSTVDEQPRVRRPVSDLVPDSSRHECSHHFVDTIPYTEYRVSKLLHHTTLHPNKNNALSYDALIIRRSNHA
jgi:hypothetical protein